MKYFTLLATTQLLSEKVRGIKFFTDDEDIVSSLAESATQDLQDIFEDTSVQDVVSTLEKETEQKVENKEEEKKTAPAEKKDEALKQNLAEAKQDEGGEEAKEGEGEKADECDTNPYSMNCGDNSGGGGWGSRWGRNRFQRDEVEQPHDLAFGEDDAVKNNPKYVKMMNQILGRNWDTSDDESTANHWQHGGYGGYRGGYTRNRYGRFGGRVNRYPFDGHGGQEENQGRGRWQGGNRGGSWSNMDQRDGWEGKGTKHGEYEDYDPYVDAEGDGDDKEHEGYYPSDHESEEKEYLNDLYRYDYQPVWKNRGRNWRYNTPYASGPDEPPATATEEGEGEGANEEGGESAESAAQIAATPVQGLAQVESSDKNDEKETKADSKLDSTAKKAEQPVEVEGKPVVEESEEEPESFGKTETITIKAPKKEIGSKLVNDQQADEDNLLQQRPKK